MEIPDEAIRWLVRNAANNSQLAILSNTSRRFREIAISEVITQAQETLNTNGNEERDLLLLPSMVRFLLCQSTDNSLESFCIAWFHPEGMEIKQVALDAADDSDDDDYMYPRDQQELSPEPFTPSGGTSYGGSEEEGKIGSRRNMARSRSPGAGLRRFETPDTHVNCMYQWNSFRDAMDVLRPFGYALQFVQVSTLPLTPNLTSKYYFFLENMLLTNVVFLESIRARARAIKFGQDSSRRVYERGGECRS
jgi:hypothetical protein